MDHSVDGVPVQVARKDTNTAIGAANNSLLPNLNEDENEVNTSDVWKAFQSGNAIQVFEPEDEALAAGTMCLFLTVLACSPVPTHASISVLARASARNRVQ